MSFTFRSTVDTFRKLTWGSPLNYLSRSSIYNVASGGGRRLYTCQRIGLVDGERSDAIPNAAGGEIGPGPLDRKA